MGLYNAFKKKLINRLHSEVVDITVGATGLTPGQLSTVVNAISEGAKTPDPKSVSGATDVYLKKIMKDFGNFSKNDAEIAIKDFIKQYLAIRFEGKTEFDGINVGKEIRPKTLGDSKSHTVRNIVYNKITIAGYEKQEEYATINYQISCGYDLDGERVETRYKVSYSLRFRENGENAVSYICPNCNAEISSDNTGECQYCGAKIVMDTIYTWYISSITEN